MIEIDSRLPTVSDFEEYGIENINRNLKPFYENGDFEKLSDNNWILSHYGFSLRFRDGKF